MFTDVRRRFDSPRLSACVPVAITNAGNLVDVEPPTERWLSCAVNRLIASCGDIRVDALTAQMIYDWHSMTAETLTVVTANDYLRAVSIVLNRLVDRGVIAQNVARYVKPLHEPPRSPKAIKESTYRKLRAAADVRMVAMLDLLWSSGCRIGGLLSIRVRDVELWQCGDEWRLAALVSEKSKTGAQRGKRQRHIYAKGGAVLSVKKWIAVKPPSPWLFCSNRDGGQLSYNAAIIALRKLRNAAGLEPGEVATYHAFRHAFAIRMLDEGKDLALVSQWLGHSDPAFTAKVYAVRDEPQLRSRFFD